MFIIGIILSYFTVLIVGQCQRFLQSDVGRDGIVGQCQLIVLSTVNNALLDGSINLTKAHRSCSCAKCIYHGNTGRALLYTDFHTL